MEEINLERGEIWTAKNIHPNTLMNVVIIQKHSGQNTVAVCPIVKEKYDNTVTIDLDGKEVCVDVRQLYTCEESKMLTKVSEVSNSIVDDLSKACLSVILG